MHDYWLIDNNPIARAADFDIFARKHGHRGRTAAARRHGTGPVAFDSIKPKKR